VQFLVHIAKKLEALHAAGWVHRDLKPANTIWLPSRNEWALIDLGCAGEVRPSNRMLAWQISHHSVWSFLGQMYYASTFRCLTLVQT
jgi:serine/threonine protein kinase